MKPSPGFSCPACGRDTTTTTSRPGTTGRIRYRVCRKCGQSFTTYQADGKPETLALTLEKPTLRPYPPPEFPTEWERRSYQEWLANLLAEVIFSC